MTVSEYNKGLEAVKAGNPAEVLLPLISTGYSPINVVYMRAAMARLKSVPKGADAEVVDSTAEVWQNDEQWKALTRAIADEYTAIRKARNKYHECRNDDQRKKVAQEVNKCWARIQAAISRRKAYEAGVEEGDTADIEENAVQVSKRINSIRAQISQTKRKIEAHVGTEKANEFERILKGKQVELAAAIQKLESMNRI